MTLEELKIIISAETKGLSKEIANVNKSLGKMSSTAQKESKATSAALGSIKSAVLGLAASILSVKTIQLGVEGMQGLNQGQSALDALNRTLGEDSTNALQSWAKNTAKYLGMGQVEALNTAMSMGTILSGFLDEADVAQGTQQLVGQMGIMAAATSKPMAQIQEAIQSAFMGSFETVENIIPTMTRALADQSAAAQYGASSFASLSSEQQRYIMYQMIMNESQKMYGNEIGAAIANTNAFKASLADAKIQLGAAFAALAPVVMPALQAIVSGLMWVLAAIYGVAQAIAGLFGKASGSKGFKNDVKDVSSSLGKAAKSSGGVAKGMGSAAKSAKQLRKTLAGFDEVNNLGPQPTSAASGGGGGGGGGGGISIPTPDTSGFNVLGEKFKAFTEQMEAFAAKAKEIFTKIAEGFKAALPYIVAIGAGLGIVVAALAGLGFFPYSIAAIIKEFGLLKGIVIIVSDTLYTLGTGVASLFSGPLFQALTASTGTITAVGGIAVAVLAAIIGAFVDLALHNEEFQNSWKTVWENIKSVLNTVWTSFIQPMFAVLMAGLTFIWEQGLKPLWDAWVLVWGEISGIITDILNGAIFPILEILIKWLGPILAAVFASLWSSVSATLTGVLKVFQVVFAAVAVVLAVVRGVIQTFIAIVKAIFTGDWKAIGETIKNIWSGVWDKIKTIVSDQWNSIKTYLAAVPAFFGSIFQSAWDKIKSIWSGFYGFFAGLWNSVKGVFTTIGVSISNSIKGAINGVFSGIESKINAFIGNINTAISLINKIPGVSVGRIGRVSLPRLAKGGIVDSGTAFIAGENGKEAIVPLDRNLGWANSIAEVVIAKMGGNTANDQPLNITLKINETTFGTVACNSINSLIKTNGVVPLNI